MVVLNNDEKEQKLDLARFAESLKGFSKGKDIISDKEFSIQNNLTIPAKTSMVIELN